VERFGRYEIVQQLGVGGMGRVALAIDRGFGERDDKLVALKLMREDFATDPEAVSWFAREARLVARLAHKNVVGIYRLGEDAGRYFISMEYVRGGSLLELITATARHGPVPVAAAVAAVIQLCRGAHAAHELRDEHGVSLGLVHRDITPHNVMVDERGTVKLLDFGIALQAGDVGEDMASGKPSYLAPEQVDQIGVDRRTDVRAIGIVLWELLAGRRRLRFATLDETVAAIRAGVAPDLRQYRADVPDRLHEILGRALAHDRSDRPGTAAALAASLEELVPGAGDASVAEVVRTHLGDVLAARRLSTVGIEQTMQVRPQMSAVDADATRVNGRAGDVTMTALADQTMAMAGDLPPSAQTELHGERAGLALQPPTFALGPNFEICSDDVAATIQIWPRPDLSREEGAEAAAMILLHLRRLLDDMPTLRGLLVDCRGAVGVLGSRTVSLIETMFRAVEARGVRIAVVITHDPIQRLDFSDIVDRACPRLGAVFTSEDAAVDALDLGR
jgi:serine/threonine-protein kinase